MKVVALSLAFSPCPNDTFVFHALVHGRVPGRPPVEVTFADVDVTNTAAERGAFDLVKVSYAALPWLLDDYELLPCGGALGRGCGPLVLHRTAAGPTSTAPRVAVPGDRTTAYLLFRLWAEAQGQPPARIEVVPFHEIMPGVADGTYDAGLVIHEARFTYPRYGLTALVDLGEWWEGDTGLPIPLGAILARRGAVDPAEAAALDPRVGPAGLGGPRRQPRLRAGARAGDGAATWSTGTSRSTSTSSPRTSAPRGRRRSRRCSTAPPPPG